MKGEGAVEELTVYGRNLAIVPQNLRSLLRVLRLLINPADGVRAPDQRHRARLLASLLLVLIALGVLGGVVPYAIFHWDGLSTDTFFWSNVFVCLLLSGVYVLSRTRHYALAANLTVVVASISAFLLAIPGEGSQDVDLLVYLVVPVILSSILLSQRATVLVSVLQLLGMLSFHVFFPRVPFGNNWVEYVLGVSILVLLDGHSRHILERQRRAALAESEARYRAVSELSSDYAYALTVMADGTLRSEWATAAFSRITGYTREAIDALDDWIAIIHPDDVPVVQARLARLMAGEEDVSEFRIITSSGEVCWLRETGRPVWDGAAGRVVRILGAAQDITAHKLVGDQQDAERALLRLAFEQLPDYFFVKDTQSRFILANPALLRHMGCENPAELIGKTDFDFYQRGLAERYYADERAVLESREPLIRREEPSINREGNSVWLLTSKIPYSDAAGNVLGVIGISQDVTARKQAQDALAHYNRRLDLLHSLDQSVLAGLPVAQISNLAVENLRDLVDAHCACLILLRGDDQAELVAVAGVDDECFPAGKAFAASDIRAAFSKQRVIDDLAAEKEATGLLGELRETGLRGCLFTPLASEGQITGVLGLGSDTPAAFGPKHQEIAWELANQLAVAIRQAHLRDQNARYASDLEGRVESRTRELKRVTDRVETILNTSSDAIVVAYQNGAIEQTNPAFDQLFQYDQDELFHRPLASVIHPDDVLRFQDALQAAIDQHQPQRLEVMVRRKDLSTFYADIGLACIERDDNPLNSVVCNLRDITERKEHEEILRQRAMHLQTVADLSTQISSTLDVERLLWDVSDLTCTMFNLYQVHFFVINEATGHLELRAAAGDVGRQNVDTGHSIPLDHTSSLVARAAREREAVVIKDVHQIPGYLSAPFLSDTRSEIAVPMAVGGRVLGVLNLQAASVDFFTEEEVLIMTTLAAQIAVALQNARLFEQTESLRYRNELLLGSSNEGICGLDAAGNVMFVNPSATALTGYGPDELVGHSFHERVHHSHLDGLLLAEDECPILQTLVDGLARTGQETVFWRADGSTMFVEFSSSPILERGEIAGSVVIFRDVTQRKRAAEALRASEQKFRRLIESAPEAILIADANGSIVIANAQAGRMLGYERVDMLGRALKQVLSIELRMNGTAQEIAALRKDGSEFAASVSLGAIETSEGTLIMCFVTDITQRKQVEEELIKNLEKERELSELKTRFVSMASHEFRTPLTTIVSSTELLEQYFDRMKIDQRARHFDKIHTAARHMIHLLDNVLVLGRADSQQLEAKPAPLDLEDLCQGLLDQVRITAPDTLTLESSVQGACEYVVLDEALLRHIVTNLLTNAVKYSPDGGIVRMDVTCTEDQVVIRVADQGIGIPQKDQEHLFEPFHRAENVHTIQGTGLGLAITWRAVALQGGHIEVDSEVGRGSTFVVTLPLTPDRQNS